jgi:hypothetical protein
MMAATATQPQTGSCRNERSRTIPIVAGAAVLLILAVWALRPSPYSRVTNLESRGSLVIAFGDSLTAGYGASAGEDYPSRLAAMTGVPVVNAGRSGDTTESALGRIENDVLSGNPRIVIVGLGGNDFLNGMAIQSTEANLRTIVRKIQGTERWSSSSDSASPASPRATRRCTNASRTRKAACSSPER